MISFNHKPKGSIIGSGSYVFRHFGNEIPQLATPSNVVVSGTTATLDAVENATSYDIRIDGTSIGTYTPWEEPIVEGDNLTITQVYGATASGTNLTLE